MKYFAKAEESALGLALLLGLALIACSKNPEDGEIQPINTPFSIDAVRVEPDSLNAYLARGRGFTSRGGEMRCAYVPVGQQSTRVFVWALCLELVVESDSLIEGSGMSPPAAFEIDIRDGKARVVGVEIPEDGNRYASSIRRIFPANLHDDILTTSARHNARSAALLSYLRTEAMPRSARARCYRSPHSVLVGPGNYSGKKKQAGWLRFETTPPARSGSVELVDSDHAGFGTTWRRAAGDSVLITAADDFLRVEMRLSVLDTVVAGSAAAHSDADFERDSTGQLRDLKREWSLRASKAPCDSMPSRWTGR